MTLVDCGSKTAIPLYVRLLNNFSIPYVAVYDADHQEHKDQQARGAADRDTALVEGEIDTNYGKSVVFVNDIEEELGLPNGNKNKPYVALSYVSDEGFRLPEQLELKVREIYE